ncbi:helix-turn-helix domain-containing protein, partial [Enterococcus nangangensis]
MNEKKKYNTIQAVVENRKSKKRASVELGLSLRQINRLVKAYQERGALAFIHGNRGKQPLNKVDAQTRKNIVKSYDSFIIKPNFKHFTEILAEDDDLHYSDTTIRHLLYEEGIFSPKSQKKT